MTWLIASAAICTNDLTTLCNPTHAGSIDVFVGNLLTGVGILVGVLTIMMVVYSGFRMIISQGKEEEIAKAKTSFQWSLIGFLVVLSAFVIVSAIGQFLQAGNVDVTPLNVQSPIASSNITDLLRVVLTGFALLVGLVSLLVIIFNGFRYITARGNEEQATQAKQGLTWAVIGLIISLLAYVIVEAVAKLFNLG